MARMLVVYRTPNDPEAFDEHYFGVHVPMARQLPGLTNGISFAGGTGLQRNSVF